MNLGGYAVVVRVSDPYTRVLAAAEAVWHDTTGFLWQACHLAAGMDRTAGRGGRRRALRGGQAASAGLQPGHVRRGRVRPEVRAVNHCVGPGRAPGAARALDVPQAAGGGGAAAPGAAGAPGDRLRPVRAHRAGRRALPDRLRRATHEPRVAIHSIAGCFFYGAFAAKVLLVRHRRLPRWVLPVAGGTLAAVLGVLWYTSALWYYNGQQLPHISIRTLTTTTGSLPGRSRHSVQVST